MNRRTFLGTVTAAALVARRIGLAADEHRIQKVGVQLYSVRDAMKADFDGTLARVSKIGYREVEFAGYFGRSPKEVKTALDRVSLASPSSHTPYDSLGDRFPAVLEGAKIIGQSYIVCPFVDEKTRQGGWKQIAETLNRAGETAQKAGVQFAYHNHSFEFEPVDGKLPYDILLSETDPKLVKIEMDLFWAVKGGADPLAYFNRYPGRFPLVHVKGRGKSGEMTEVAADNSIDWKAIFAQSGKAGIQHYFVEHDEPKDPFVSIQASYSFMSQVRF
jgi:sugar phosphate isomerase/epimerase